MPVLISLPRQNPWTQAGWAQRQQRTLLYAELNAAKPLRTRVCFLSLGISRESELRLGPRLNYVSHTTRDVIFA